MKIQTIGFVAVVNFALAFATAGAAADDNDPVFRLSTGIDYTSGDYGGVVDIEDVYVPITGSADYGRFGFRLTVPYLSVTAPAGTIITGPGGQPVPGSGAATTESGLGDVIGSVTMFDVVANRELGIALDVTAKIKFATADETKGLGTGENDYSVQADVYKFFDRITLLGTAGYKVRGDPAGIDLENVFFGSLGGIYNFTPETRGGLIVDYRESAYLVAGGTEQRDPIEEFVHIRLHGIVILAGAQSFRLISGRELDLGGNISSAIPSSRLATTSNMVALRITSLPIGLVVGLPAPRDRLPTRTRNDSSRRCGHTQYGTRERKPNRP